MSRSAGRRVAERPTRARRGLPRVSADMVIGLVAVLVAGVTFATVADRPEPRPDRAVAPGASPLTEAVLTCPSGDAVTIAQPVAGEGTGELTIAVGDDDPQPVDMAPGGAVGQDVSGPSVLRATGALAPALVAAVRSGKQVTECVPPSGEWWFGAVGAGGLHASTLTLVNPDAAPAIADLEVWSAEGRESADAVRGIAVDGDASVSLDLAELVPTRDDAMVHVIVRQGRVGAHLVDQTVVGATPHEVSHAATVAPSPRQVLPAVPPGRSTLVVGNPGEEAARFQLKVSGAESEAVPLDVAAVPVAAGEVVSVALDANTRKLLRSGGASLVVEGTAPLVATLRGAVAGEPVTVAAAEPATGRSATFLPALPSRTLVLTAVDRATAATVRFDAGKEWRGRLRPGVSTVVRVPKAATSFWVETPDGIHQGAVRSAGPDDASWQPLRQLREERLVPVVRPDQLRPGVN